MERSVFRCTLPSGERIDVQVAAETTASSLLKQLLAVSGLRNADQDYYLVALNPEPCLLLPELPLLQARSRTLEMRRCQRPGDEEGRILRLLAREVLAMTSSRPLPPSDAIVSDPHVALPFNEVRHSHQTAIKDVPHPENQPGSQVQQESRKEEALTPELPISIAKGVTAANDENQGAPSPPEASIVTSAAANVETSQDGAGTAAKSQQTASVPAKMTLRGRKRPLADAPESPAPEAHLVLEPSDTSVAAEKTFAAPSTRSKSAMRSAAADALSSKSKPSEASEAESAPVTTGAQAAHPGADGIGSENAMEPAVRDTASKPETAPSTKDNDVTNLGAESAPKPSKELPPQTKDSSPTENSASAILSAESDSKPTKELSKPSAVSLTEDTSTSHRASEAVSKSSKEPLNGGQQKKEVALRSLPDKKREPVPAPVSSKKPPADSSSEESTSEGESSDEDEESVAALGAATEPVVTVAASKPVSGASSNSSSSAEESPSESGSGDEDSSSSASSSEDDDSAEDSADDLDDDASEQPSEPPPSALRVRRHPMTVLLLHVNFAIEPSVEGTQCEEGSWTLSPP